LHYQQSVCYLNFWQRRCRGSNIHYNEGLFPLIHLDVSPSAFGIYLDRTSEPIYSAGSITANRTSFASDIGPSIGPCSPVASECTHGVPYLNPLESFASIDSIAFLTRKSTFAWREGTNLTLSCHDALQVGCSAALSLQSDKVN
jgi:hypothetical protein